MTLNIKSSGLRWAGEKKLATENKASPATIHEHLKTASDHLYKSYTHAVSHYGNHPITGKIKKAYDMMADAMADNYDEMK